jgi:hypothetical protein
MAWQETATANSKLLVVVDEDDPAKNEYLLDTGTVDAIAEDWAAYSEVLVVTGERQRIGPLLNQIAAQVADAGCRAVGFMGDDHWPRTRGWDARMLDALDQLGTGLVYGNDLLQGENLPTAVAMTSDIVRTLGWMVPPGMQHLYLDDAWLALGRAIGRITYLPDVVIEHRHPIANKAPWDDTYREANDGALYIRDKVAFERWRNNEMSGDVERLQGILRG